MKSVVFRTKANHQQGMGDISGSLALAEEFSSHNYQVTFLLDNHRAAVQSVQAKGYKFLTKKGKSERRFWLTQQTVDVAVVNQLNSDYSILQAIKEHCKKLVTIDDTGLASRQLADLRVNPLYYDNGAVCDPAYIPLHKVFQSGHSRRKAIKPAVKRLLISLGGSDTYGFTPQLVEIAAEFCPDVEITAVLGPAFRHRGELNKSLAKIAKTIKLAYSLSADQMCQRMFSADALICSGGNTMFEAACLGLPALVICAEPFEQESALRMQKFGTCLAVPFSRRLSRRLIIGKLKGLFAYENRKRFSRAGKKLIDGRGTSLFYKLVAAKT